MSKWEVCKIENLDIRLEKEGRSGGFWVWVQWIAVAETSEGRRTIDKSSECKLPDGILRTAAREQENLKLDAILANEHARLVGRLLENGWEPIAADESGNVNVLKRQNS